MRYDEKKPHLSLPFQQAVAVGFFSKNFRAFP
jgi:hypothetical protein